MSSFMNYLEANSTPINGLLDKAPVLHDGSLAAIPSDERYSPEEKAMVYLANCAYHGMGDIVAKPVGGTANDRPIVVVAGIDTPRDGYTDTLSVLFWKRDGVSGVESVHYKEVHGYACVSELVARIREG